jgi:radical SAM superfamily enzyme YgiQ (UPF0313 family)
MTSPRPIQVVLVSTYDLGRQPFGLASPAAWLREAGADVSCLDLAVEPPDDDLLGRADVVAFHVPMHTAMLPRVRSLRPQARIACYGLYAGVHADTFRRLGADACFAGEYEQALTGWATGGREADGPAAPAGGAPAGEAAPPGTSWDRLAFRVPDRAGLPRLERYARLAGCEGGERTVGYTEASRGCRHRCRHCPVVPVYRGRFRIVPADVVLEDIRRQVAAGARHVTFGDPDFWNGIGHALPIVRALHVEHPDLTYDVTIKVEHLLRHRRHLAELRRTGCLFVTSAVESLDDEVLARLAKGHTRADFLAALGACRAEGLRLQPTFVAFTPWTTAARYLDLLDTLAELGLVEDVAPVQLAIRLLLPAGSLLLDDPDVRAVAGPFDPGTMAHPWLHPDPAVDELQRRVFAEVRRSAATGCERPKAFARVADIAHAAAGADGAAPGTVTAARAPVPYLTEPWYC